MSKDGRQPRARQVPQRRHKWASFQPRVDLGDSAYQQQQRKARAAESRQRQNLAKYHSASATTIYEGQTPPFRLQSNPSTADTAEPKPPRGTRERRTRRQYPRDSLGITPKRSQYLTELTLTTLVLGVFALDPGAAPSPTIAPGPDTEPRVPALLSATPVVVS